MEQIEEIDEYITELSKISLEKLLPDDIYYPGQERIIENSFYKNDPDDSIHLNQKNSNLNKFNNFNLSTQNSWDIPLGQKRLNNFTYRNIKMTNSPKKLCKTSNSKNYLNMQNFSTNSLNNIMITDLEKKEKIYESQRLIKKIDFSTEDDQVYDIFLNDEILVACGGKFIKVYNFQKLKCLNKKDDDTAALIFSDMDEDFYALSYTFIQLSEVTKKTLSKSKHVLAIGGKKSVIRLIDLQEGEEYSQLIGHRHEIYDLKFHPSEDKSHLLLSASKDFSVRLWNVLNNLQVCIFGGPEGHSADVLSVDWHISGNYFVSSGVDYFVKIWEIDAAIQKIIDLSNTIKNRKEKREKKFKTKIKTRSIFSCNSIHENYVDCVKFNGNFILSKSVDGNIKEWQPIFNKEGDYFFIINTYIYPLAEKIWYVKIGLDQLNKKIMGIGNTNGEVFFFNLSEISNKSDDDILKESEYFFSVNPSSKLHTENASVIRCISFDPLSNYLAFGTNNGEIYIAEKEEEL